MNNENLKPIQSTSEAREKGKIGGIKSGEVRRKQKEFRDVCKFALAKGQEYGLNDLLAKLQDTKTSAETKIKILQFLADYSGQKPAERQEILGGDLMIEVYNDNN